MKSNIFKGYKTILLICIAFLLISKVKAQTIDVKLSGSKISFRGLSVVDDSCLLYTSPSPRD